MAKSSRLPDRPEWTKQPIQHAREAWSQRPAWMRQPALRAKERVQAALSQRQGSTKDPGERRAKRQNQRAELTAKVKALAAKRPRLPKISTLPKPSGLPKVTWPTNLPKPPSVAKLRETAQNALQKPLGWVSARHQQVVAWGARQTPKLTARAKALAAKRPQLPKLPPGLLVPPDTPLIVLGTVGFLVLEGLIVGILPGSLPEEEPLSVAAQRQAVSVLATHIPTSLASKGSELLSAKAALDESIGAIEKAGYQVGYCVLAPGGQSIAALNENTTFYGASSIKGPFVISAYSQNAPASYRTLIENTIVYSDNDAYRALKASAGTEVLSGLLDKLGIQGWSEYNSFLYMTPKQLAELWVGNYDKLMDSGEAATWLRGLFRKPINSPISELSGATTASKGGWIDEGGYSATVDAGVITRGSTTYIMAVMTDKGDDFDALTPVIKNLDAYVTARIALDQ